jgi:hypothetical protein
MKKQIFAILIICCILAPIIIFGSYQLGVSNGVSSGYSQGYVRGQASNNLATGHIYQEGFDAGLKASQNITSSP